MVCVVADHGLCKMSELNGILTLYERIETQIAVYHVKKTRKPIDKFRNALEICT